MTHTPAARALAVEVERIMLGDPSAPLSLDEAAMRVVSAARPACTWTYVTDEPDWVDDGHYDTSCGEASCYENDGPAENNHRFCPYCGGSLVVAEPGPGEAP